MRYPMDHARLISQSTTLNQHMDRMVDIAKNRLLVTLIAFCFTICVIGCRLFDVMVLRHDEQSMGDRGGNPCFLSRSDMVDRHGTVVATTLTTFSLFANGAQVLDPKDTVAKLKAIFPRLSVEDLLKKLQEKKTFVWIQRHLTPEQQQAVIQLGLPGIDFLRDSRRIYPHGALFSHILGYTDIDNNGIAGLEKSQDDFLKQGGAPLRLTIDLRLQHLVKDELLKGVEEFGCLGASGLLMDMETGEILASVSLPDYNPNDLKKVTEDQLFNKNTLGIYEMGSIMKIANTAMGLETNTVSVGSLINASDPLRVGRFTITDYRANHGIISVGKGFVKSSNKVSARIALKAGAEAQKSFLKRIGFLDKPRFDLPEVGAPIVPKRWREATSITVSYGYGLSISPLQALSGIASIIQGGQQIYPTLLMDHIRPKGPRVVRPEVSKQMLQLMRFVVTEGTARKSNLCQGYFVAGKTGTANYLDPRGYYDKNRVTTTFVGVLGEDSTHPKYAIMIRLDDPKRLKKTFGFNAGGWNAAPVAGRIFHRLAPMMGMLPRHHEPEHFDTYFRTASFTKKP